MGDKGWRFDRKFRIRRLCSSVFGFDNLITIICLQKNRFPALDEHSNHLILSIQLLCFICSTGWTARWNNFDVVSIGSLHQIAFNPCLVHMCLTWTKMCILSGLWLTNTSQLPGAGLSNQSPILLFHSLQLDDQPFIFHYAAWAIDAADR